MTEAERDLARLESLAGLSLTADERRRLAADLQRLLTFLGELPDQTAALAAGPGGPLREDEPAVTPLAGLTVALRDGWFTVPPLRNDGPPEADGVA